MKSSLLYCLNFPYFPYYSYSAYSLNYLYELLIVVLEFSRNSMVNWNCNLFIFYSNLITIFVAILCFSLGLIYCSLIRNCSHPFLYSIMGPELFAFILKFEIFLSIPSSLAYLAIIPKFLSFAFYFLYHSHQSILIIIKILGPYIWIAQKGKIVGISLEHKVYEGNVLPNIV